MNHLDLFSGIGGFALAVDTVWPGSTHTFVDNDLFCRQVLTKHWPNAKVYGDIRDFIRLCENAPDVAQLLTSPNPTKHGDGMACKSIHNKQWRSKNRSRHNARVKEWWQEKRLEAIKELGGRCQCCGETNPAFLCLDHKNNDGYLDRKSNGKRRIWIEAVKDKDAKERYQILCYNCNMAKAIYKICPHQR
jgi:hypothetical protein